MPKNYCLEDLGFQSPIPSDYSFIRYDKEGVYIADEFVRSDNPRLLFAKVLSCTSDKVWYNPVRAGGNVKIGQGCTIGGNGFGYVKDGETNFLMPHRGIVVIEDDVIIHNLVNIDRAVIGETRIGNGCVIDSFVHVAHGAKIGSGTQIVAGSIIGGSVTIGKNCFIGMGAKIKNKVTIGDNCTIGAGAVVLKDVPSGETWVGVPAYKLH